MREVTVSKATDFHKDDSLSKRDFDFFFHNLIIVKYSTKMNLSDLPEIEFVD